MKSYIELAYYYDRLMDHVDFNRVAEFYLTAADHFGWHGSRILDLACGTGSIMLELLKKGYDVCGVDVSPEMLAAADKKTYEAGFRPDLVCQDMRKLDFNTKYDLIICAFDSLNYLLKETDLEKAFLQVSNVLEQDGIFLFDVHSEYKFKEVLGESIFTHVSDDICYIWQNNYSHKTSICTMNLDIFVKNGNGWYQRIEEIHREHFYSPDTIERFLSRQGLQVLAVYADMNFKKPGSKAERLYYVVKKQQ